MRISILMLLFVFSNFPQGKASTLYQYEVDGRIIFSDQPPPDQKAQAVQLKEIYTVSHHPTHQKSQIREIYSNTQVNQWVKHASVKYGISEKLIHSIIKIESNYNPQAVSRKGAQGLMQIMPDTAKYLGLQNPFDPASNIDAGVRYFRKLLDQFNGDTTLALAAYNAGPTNVEKYKGIPPFTETQDYVKKINNYYSRLSSG